MKRILLPPVRMSQEPRPRVFAPGLLKALGVIAILGGLVDGAITASFLASAETAEGIVVDIRNIKAGYGRARRKPTASIREIP